MKFRQGKIPEVKSNGREKAQLLQFNCVLEIFRRVPLEQEKFNFREQSGEKQGILKSVVSETMFHVLDFVE